MKKTTIAILAVAVLTLGAIFIFAQKGVHGSGGFHDKGGHRAMKMFLRGLDLTEEQKTQVKQIAEASRTKVQPVFEAMKANREKMKAATDGGKFDEEAVSAIAAEQGSLAAKLIVEKESVKSQIFAILTDEQKAKALEKRAKMEERFENKMKSGDIPDVKEF